MLEKSVDMAIGVSVDMWKVDEAISTCIDYFSPHKSNLRKSGGGRPDGTVTPPSQLGWPASPWDPPVSQCWGYRHTKPYPALT